jgi:hypoxanthine phosphoribosyltransferase
MINPPRIFVGSSQEGIEVARAIQFNLRDVGHVITWDNDIFRLSEYTYASLDRELSRAQYGIFVLTADDIAVIRGTRRRAPRDNVVFEIGLFMGRLGLHRTFLVHPDSVDLRVPTDLLGVTTARYRSDMSTDLPGALGPACTQIRTKIRETWHTELTATWDEMVSWVSQLSAMLRQSTGLGGFGFDVIVGINRGGIIVADLLARSYASTMPLLSIWADRRGDPSGFSPPGNWVNSHAIKTLSLSQVQNIILVDDIARRGVTLPAARTFLSESLPDKQIKTAALVIDHSAEGTVDYYVVKTDAKRLRMPFSALG